MGNNCKRLFLAFLIFAGCVSSAEEEEGTQVAKKLPIGADLYVTNNVGASTAFKAYQQDPYITSFLYLYPYYKTEPFWGEREFHLQTEFSTAFEWMGKDNPILGKITDKFTLGDLKIRAELKKALQFNALGLSLSPAFKLEAPVSQASRNANRVIGLGGYFVAAWSKWGFFLSYKPVALGYAYSEPFLSGPCAESALGQDKLDNGQCKAAGRQTMLLVKNGLFAGYKHDNHTITLGYRSYHSFLRKAASNEKAEEKPTSGIMESSLGVLEYSYLINSMLPTTFCIGLSSLQNPYDIKEGFRIPFFSFADAKNNLTEAYLAVNLAM